MMQSQSSLLASSTAAVPPMSRAAARLRIGDRVDAEAKVRATPATLLAIGGMVGLILLGSALIVRAARI